MTIRPVHVDVQFLAGDAACAPSARVRRAVHAPWFAAGIVVLVLLIHAPLLRGQFLGDDAAHVAKLVRYPSLASGIRAIWSRPLQKPLAETILLVEARLLKQRPGGYRAANIALHAVNALLLCGIARRIAPRAAILGALLFAAVPMHLPALAGVQRQQVLLGCALALLAIRLRRRRFASALLVLATLACLDFHRPLDGASYMLAIALAGAGIMLALALDRLDGKLYRRTAAVIASLAIAVAAIFSFARGGEFQSDEARALAELRRNPASVASLVSLGRLELKRNRASRGLGYFQRALRLDPRHRPALLGCAAAYEALGELDKSLALYHGVVSLDPNDVDGIFGVGSIYARQPGRADEALRQFSHVLSLQKDHLEALLQIAALHAQRGDSSQAMRALERAIAIAPHDARAPVEAARVAYAHLHDPERALALLRQARAVEVADPQALLLAGAILFQQARSAPPRDPAARELLWKSEMFFREAVRVAPELPLAQVNLGKALAARSMRETRAEQALACLSESIICFERAIRLDPSDAESSQLLEAAVRDRDRLEARFR